MQFIHSSSPAASDPLWRARPPGYRPHTARSALEMAEYLRREIEEVAADYLRSIRLGDGERDGTLLALAIGLHRARLILAQSIERVRAGGAA